MKLDIVEHPDLSELVELPVALSSACMATVVAHVSPSSRTIISVFCSKNVCYYFMWNMVPSSYLL